MKYHQLSNITKFKGKKTIGLHMFFKICYMISIEVFMFWSSIATNLKKKPSSNEKFEL